MMNREKQKKEQKTFEYIENPEQIEGFDKIPVPEDLHFLHSRMHSGKNSLYEAVSILRKLLYRLFWLSVSATLRCSCFITSQVLCRIFLYPAFSVG